MIQKTVDRGLNMPDIQLMCKALKVTWIKRLLKEENRQWKVIPLYYLEKAGGKLVFECNYDLKLLLRHRTPIRLQQHLNNLGTIKTNNNEDIRRDPMEQ